MMLNPLNKSFWRKLWKQELGFTLIEVVAATFIAGTVVVGSVVVLGTAVRSAGSTQGSLELQQLVQTQIETIQQVPFSDVGDYPVLKILPDGVSITVTTTGADTNYRFPNPDGSFVTNVVQRIEVTAARTGSKTVTMIFFKIEVP